MGDFQWEIACSDLFFDHILVGQKCSDLGKGRLDLALEVCLSRLDVIDPKGELVLDVTLRASQLPPANQCAHQV